MPTTIKQGSTVKATYTYLADGTKIKAVNAYNGGSDYVGSFKYNRNGSNISLESVATAGGRTYKTSGGYEARYFISDHLGSTRLIAYPNGSVIEQNDYMPYGERHSNSALATSGNPYLYNGKESQKSFGINYIDSEARFQRLDGAFNSIDPLCEENYWISPYSYCNGNPIKFIDSDGNKVYFAPNVSDKFKQKFAETVKYMNERGTSKQLADLEKSNKIFYIAPEYISSNGEIKTNGYSPDINLILWNPDIMYQTTEGFWLSPATILGHELGHAYQHLTNPEQFFSDTQKSDNVYKNLEEKRNIKVTEQDIAKKHNEITEGQVTRQNHKVINSEDISIYSPYEIEKLIIRLNAIFNNGSDL